MTTTRGRGRRSRGFTILEILIAIVVLVLGIMGIIALFPTAIESGNRTVEDSYAAAITQSVVDAITVGLRESRYTHDSLTPGPNGPYTYFIFNHDGVLDQSPRTAGDLDSVEQPAGMTEGGFLWARDYCVILPKGPLDNAQLSKEPVFLYPPPAKPEHLTATPNDPNDLRQRHHPTKLTAAAPDFDLFDDLKDADGRGMRSTVDGNRTVWIRRVYPLGRYRTPETGTLPERPGTPGELMQKGDVRLEFRGDAIVSGGGTNSTSESIAVDPYPTYSFAFSLQRARIDTHGAVAPATGGDGKVDANDRFSDTLYQLRVMIFKNFDVQAANSADLESVGGTGAIPRTNVPIKEFVTLLAL